MAIATSNISLQSIQAEVGHSTSSNISLQAQSQNVSNTGHTSTISGYTSPGGGLTGAPYGMGEFGGYVNVIQTVSNVQNYTGVVAAEFFAGLSYSGGFGADSITYQLVMRTSTSGSNYVATLYVEETSDSSGVYNSGGMTTGTLYPVQTITFTQGNWPDSYALDHSVSIVTSGGAVQAGTLLAAGAGEANTSGANWDNVTFELLNPTTNTAFRTNHLTTGECFTGTVIYTDTYSLKFIKSGYPTLTAVTFNIACEQDMSHSGICP